MKRLHVHLLSALFLFTVPTFAADGTTRPSPLAAVKALDQPVTYTETKIPLGELVAKAAKDTGVALTAAPDVADEPVAVVVKDLPARELLEQLAELLDYRWSRRSGVQAFGRSGVPGRPTNKDQRPTGDASRLNARTPERLNAPVLEIWQDLASKQREEALRQGVFGEAEKRFQEELATAQEMAGMSSEEIRRIREEEKQRGPALLRLPPAQRADYLNSPEQRERTKRMNLGHFLWSPATRSMAQMLGRFTAEQWAALRRGEQIVLSSTPQPGEFPLPAEMSAVFHATHPTALAPGDFVMPPEGVDENQSRRAEREMQEQWASATGYRVTVRLDSARLRDQGAIHLDATALPTRDGALLRMPMISAAMMLHIDARAADPERERRDEDTPERRAAMEKDPLLSARKLFKAEVKSRPNPYFTGSAPNSRFPLGNLLPEVARVYGGQFIADAYWTTPPVLGTGSSGEPRALYALLDRLTQRSHRWDRRGKLIRFRSRSWFFDRPREVPLRFVRRWNELFEKHGALTFEAYLEAATALTDVQMGSILTIVQSGAVPYGAYDLQMIPSARRTLQLYAALTPAQRKWLWDGNPLPLSQMTAPQVGLITARFTEDARSSPSALIQPPKVSPEDLAVATFSLTPEPSVRTQKGGSISRPSVLSPPAAPSARSPAPAGEVKAPPVYPVTRIRFGLQFGDQRRPMGWEITVAALQ